MTHQQRLSIREVDPGAYTAVLALGLARRLPLEELAERANRYAAWVASMPS